VCVCVCVFVCVCCMRACVHVCLFARAHVCVFHTHTQDTVSNPLRVRFGLLSFEDRAMLFGNVHFIFHFGVVLPLRQLMRESLMNGSLIGSCVGLVQAWWNGELKKDLSHAKRASDFLEHALQSKICEIQGVVSVRESTNDDAEVAQLDLLKTDVLKFVLEVVVNLVQENIKGREIFEGVQFLVDMSRFLLFTWTDIAPVFVRGICEVNCCFAPLF
jgi:hypothetical protein